VSARLLDEGIGLGANRLVDDIDRYQSMIDIGV
jgi:hypothetical protein